MRDQPLSTDLRAESRQPGPAHVWLTVGAAGAATSIVGPTLVALSQGADYRVVGAEDDFAHALGDPREASFAAALDYIRHGRCAS